MANSVTIMLSDETYHRVQRFAQMIGQSLGEVIANAVETTIPDVADTHPIADLTDKEILLLCEVQMSDDDDMLHSRLLDKQQAGLLTDGEQAELWRLTQLYQILLLRKSQALAEAVKRGLRSPLEP